MMKNYIGSPKFFPQFNAGMIIVVILSFILGWQLGHKDYSLKWKNFRPYVNVTNQRNLKNTSLDFKLFWETWDLVSSKYIEKAAIDPQKLYYGAISGMVAAVGDPYTVFLPPQSQKATKEQLSGSFDGVGIQLGYNKDKRLVVIAPLKGTPAYNAGVESGDMILKIDDKDAANLALPEAVNSIRGLKGSIVELTLLGEDDSKPRQIKITRDTIVIKSVEYEPKNTKSNKKIGYIRLSSFNEKTKSEWNEVVGQAMKDDVKGVAIDVRNNPGGFLEAAVYVSSEFLEGGDVAIQENAQGERQSYKVVRVGKMLQMPLVVLINKGSASASEIFAGAIMDRKRGDVIGESSFGKGTIQSAEDLAENTGIHITTAKWLTPNGNSVHGVGISPDIKVESVDVTTKGTPALPNSNGSTDKQDPQLEEALEVLDQKV